jgi:uncharacterized membrane protein
MLDNRKTIERFLFSLEILGIVLMTSFVIGLYDREILGWAAMSVLIIYLILHEYFDNKAEY